MRGKPETQPQLFYTITDWDEVIPADHPLHRIKRVADERLRQMGPLFDAAYSSRGRPSIPPEQLIKAMVLQALFSIRSERQLCEQIQYNLLYKWFLGLDMDADAWHPTVFTKNRERIHENGLMVKFFQGTVQEAIEQVEASSEHFSVDGSLIEAWASMKSFRARDEDDDEDPGDGTSGSNRWVDWKGEKRSNKSHESRTDPQAKLARKGNGQGAILAHSIHALTENKHGLLVDVAVGPANGQAERAAALAMLDTVAKDLRIQPRTVGADKGYDDGGFLQELEEGRQVVPHVAIRSGKISKNNPTGKFRLRARRRSRNKGFSISQCRRMMIEGVFGWLKRVAGLHKTRFIGHWKTETYAYASAATYNLLRLSKISGKPAPS